MSIDFLARQPSAQGWIHPVPMGQSRVDVLGYAKGGFWSTERIVAVELKNNIEQLRRGLDQMTNYTDYAHQVYLACTPALAANYLKSYLNAQEVQSWDAKALDRKLKKLKVGLLLVENTQVYEVTVSGDFSPDDSRLQQVRGFIMKG